MSPEFEEKIKTFPHPLFYNSKGSTLAYKLGIRHLSAACFAGVARQVGNSIYPNESIYIVDLEQESITQERKKVKLIKLESL
jgi:hypothetical protein